MKFTRWLPGFRLAVAAACATLSADLAFLAAAEPPDAAVLQQAEAQFKSGQRTEALASLTRFLSDNPKHVGALGLRGRFHEEMREHTKAIADYDQVLKLQPKATSIWQHRAEELFRLGRFREAVADFDQVIKLAPEQEPQHWQRGIAHYYAGQFEKGRKQFELHQTVNPQDVENAVWHFLCVTRLEGVDKARAVLIPIEKDPRVPMKEVHALFAGKAKAEDVMAAAQKSEPGSRPQESQLFFAHLYLGLYYEATGETARAREHIFKAAGDFKAEHYMGDVARVHAAALRRNKK